MVFTGDPFTDTGANDEPLASELPAPQDFPPEEVVGPGTVAARNDYVGEGEEAEEPPA